MQGNIGVIGVGNMAKAIIEGALRGGFSPSSFLLLEHTPSKGLVRAWGAEKGIAAVETLDALLQGADVIMLAVKPVVLQGLVKELAPFAEGRAFISIAAGWTTRMLEQALPGGRVLWAMPNTPMQVGRGYTSLSEAHSLTEEEYALAKALFAASGVAAELPERLMSAASVVAGCTPAYACIFIDALADAGVRAGLPRKLAIEMAATAVGGAGDMVRKTGQHPDALRDAVCSPGGSTIEGVYQLEAGGLRAAVMEAVQASINKSLTMGAKD